MTQDPFAQADFCRLYWHPLYAFLRGRGYPEAEAQDHVQTFFLRVFELDWLEKADAERGRLRSYLLTLLTRHVSAERTRQAAQRRGGTVEHLSLDVAAAESAYQSCVAPGASPEDVFRRALAVALVDEALENLRERYAKSGQSEVLEALLPALEGPLVDDSYAALGVRLGLTEGAVRVAAVRMRERFREGLRAAASVALRQAPGPALDDELRELFG